MQLEVINSSLEYSNSVLGPYFVLDQRKIKKVQQRATKMIVPLQDMTYEERLQLHAIIITDRYLLHTISYSHSYHIDGLEKI